MKKLIIYITFILLLSINNATAVTFRCGAQPMKPMACFSGKFVCVCDPQTGQSCNWLLVDCRY